MKLAKTTLAENENSYKCSSCIVYTVLLWIFCTVNVGGIGAIFVKHINGRNRTNQYYKSNLLFLQ